MKQLKPVEWFVAIVVLGFIVHGLLGIWVQLR